MRTVYVITPTYARTTQQPDLTRMSQALMLAKPPLHWIVVEDRHSPSTWVTELLKRLSLPYTHLAIHINASARQLKKNYTSPKKQPCRGKPQRNLALQWLLKFAAQQDAIIYFGDDDNSYDVQLFEEVHKYSMFQVIYIPIDNAQSISMHSNIHILL